MAEDQSPDKSTIASLSSDDITPDIYEGGFKTWECSLDLAGYLNTLLSNQQDYDGEMRHFIEVDTMNALLVSQKLTREPTQ